MKTLSLFLVTAAAALPGRAEILPPQELTRIFAACAGRYSAQTEHLWSVDGAASEEAARRRDLFVDLAAAAGQTPPGMAPDMAMGWRVSAKAAQRQLLDAATYATGPRASRAGRLADQAKAQCDRLLLGL